MKPRPLAVMVVCAFLLPSGCASMSSKFVPQTKENVGVFADTTITMLSNLEFGFNRNESIYVKEFFDPKGAEENQLVANNKALVQATKNIVRYSLQLVIIAETHDQESERVAAYAGYFANVDPDIIEARGYDKNYFIEVVQKIKSQEKFLDALKTAQPIISGMTSYVNAVLDQKQAVTESLAAKLETRIDERYAEVIRYQKALETEKYAVLRALGYLYKTYSGDPAAFDKLLASGIIRDKKLIPKGNPTIEDLRTIAEHLGNRLKGLHLIGEEIKPDWDDYRATQRELDTLLAAAMDRINKARLVTLVWLRAHQKMAAGIVSPAEWFNIQDLPSQLIGLGSKAIF